MHPRSEGVLQAEKDFNLKEHAEIAGVPNLQVIKLMQSFKSKELVTERFSWRHYYWCVHTALRHLAGPWFRVTFVTVTVLIYSRQHMHRRP